jgi:Lipopolysaccharide-assembly
MIRAQFSAKPRTRHPESVSCTRDLLSSWIHPDGRAISSLGIAVFLCCSAAIAGCGYHTAGHFNTLPKSIHVIAVPAMENKTTKYQVEQKLTAATIHEFLAKTTYKVVPNANDGDAVLTGKVLSMEVVPLLFQTTTTQTSSTAQATAMLVTMKCEVTLTERDNDKVLYHNDNFVFRNEYELSTDVRSFFQEGDPALDRMAEDFARRLVSAVTENF